MAKATAESPSPTALTAVSSSLIERNRMMEQDAGFMARAAASAPPSLLPERKLIPRSSGGFTEMIRGITGLSTAADVHSLMHHSSRSSADLAMAGSSVELGFVPSLNAGVVAPLELGFSAASSVSSLPSAECGFAASLSVSTMRSLSSSSSCPVPCVELGLGDASTVSVVRPSELGLGASPLSSVIHSAEVQFGASSLVSAAELGSGGTVTPSTKLGLGPLSVRCTADSRGIGYGGSQKAVLEGGDGVGDGKLVTLSLLPDTPRVESPCECSPSTGSTPPVGVESLKCCAAMNGFQCNLSFLEQIYNNSSEPVVLVDDSQVVVWFNKAYEKALKDAMDRPAVVVPYIDPLGVPTRLGRFDLPREGFSSSFSVTLWGFLKKLVVDVEGGAAGVSLSGPLLNSSHDSPIAQCKIPLQLKHEAVGRGTVIMPQPIRLIGSTVSLVSITDLQSQTSPLPDTLDLVKKQLEAEASPAFISDSSNLVRWVNTAYKQMVGQPECLWLNSTVGDSLDCESLQSPRPAGGVVLCCSVGVPVAAPAFSGCVNIQWTNAGERNCMTLPCDVIRLDCCSNGRVMLVWKFDIQASLSLTCGV